MIQLFGITNNEINKNCNNAVKMHFIYTNILLIRDVLLHFKAFFY